MKLTNEHLDATVEGVEIEGVFDISFNEEAKEAGRKHRVNYTLTSDGITLRDLLTQAGRPRVITKQNAMRRNVKDEAEFVKRCKEADKMKISLKPGAGGIGRGFVSDEQALNIVLSRIQNGTWTEKNCPESLKPYFSQFEEMLAEAAANEEMAKEA